MRFRKALVTLQVALCFCLMIGASLFARTPYNLQSVDLGLRKENVITFSMDASQSGYKREQAQNLYQRLEESPAVMPGVRSVAFSDHGVLKNSSNTTGYEIEGYQPKSPGGAKACEVLVTPGYLRAVGMCLMAGRDFCGADLPPAQVAIVNQSFARRFFDNQNPVGGCAGRFPARQACHAYRSRPGATLRVGR